MENQHLKEASRYIENARELLSEKAQKEGNYYNDRKYVKLAGHAAYSGVLVALDGLLGSKKKGRMVSTRNRSNRPKSLSSL